MRLQQDRLQAIKPYLHATQACLVLLAIILYVAVYTRDDANDARTGWFFAVCCLTIPATIYLVMVSRTPGVSNVYIFATLEAIFTISRLHAGVSFASYISAAGGCSGFLTGSTSECKMSIGIVVLGVLIGVLFGVTSFLSSESLIGYRRTGLMPSAKQPNEFEKHTTDDAFSSNMQIVGLEEGRLISERKLSDVRLGRSTS